MARPERPAVLVHSSGSSSRQWRLLASWIERAGRAASAPDLTGSGAMPRIPRGQPVSIEADLQIVRACLDQASEPVDLIGHSYGGWLAMRAALDRPGRVRQVLAHEPVLWGVLFEAGDPAILGEFEALGRDGMFADPAHAATEAWWERFVDFWNGAGAWAGLREPERVHFREVGWKVFHEVRTLIEDRTTLAEWGALACPLRVSVGAASPAPEREVVRLLGELPGVEVREIPGGHMAPLTHARSFLALYADWLALEGP